MAELVKHPRVDPSIDCQTLLTHSLCHKDLRMVSALFAHPASRLHGLLDMRESSKSWGPLEVAATRLARAHTLDASLALVSNSAWSGMSRDRLRLLTLLSCASFVLKTALVLASLELPLRALLAIFQATHAVITMVPETDLTLLVVHAVSQKKRRVKVECSPPRFL